ncbi:MAG: hypothetical protein IMZ75_04425 [Actinobacteria bacterium]|nr:hypothetical protein [Actinomycetota bacterium]
MGDDLRIIEVKARAGYGDVETPERELDALRAAGEPAWLYAVYDTTQRGDFELWVVQDPANRLSWVKTSSYVRASTRATSPRPGCSGRVTSPFRRRYPLATTCF